MNGAETNAEGKSHADFASPIPTSPEAVVSQQVELAPVVQPVDKPKPKGQIALGQKLFEAATPQNPIDTTKDFMDRMQFQKRGERLGVRGNLIKIMRRITGGGLEAYEDKEGKEKKKGRDESAEYGDGQINGHKATVVETTMAYWAGSLGVVMGEVVARAADHAIKEKGPLIGIYSSAGARQQESASALKQMSKIVKSIRDFKEKSNMPYVSIANESWGGISASAVPLGDVVAGMEGTGFGFAGPRVLDQYQKKLNPKTLEKTPRWAQSVENHYVHGNVDIVIKDVDELEDWVGAILEFSEHLKHRPELPSVDAADVSLPRSYKRFPLGKNAGIVNRIYASDEERVYGEELMQTHPEIFSPEPPAFEGSHPEDPHEQYKILTENPYRLDTELLMHMCFDTFVPMYSIAIDGRMVMYPDMIWGLATIQEQPYLVIGNQPDYAVMPNGKSYLRSKNPGAKDFRRRDQWLEVGKRLGLPLVSFVNTLGAEPTLEQEQQGLAHDIAQAIDAGNEYPHPSFTYVVGGFGSGGGLASGPEGDENMMLSGAHKYVAPPESYATILYNTDEVDRELVIDAIRNGQFTAEDQMEFKLIDGVLYEPPGGIQSDPINAARMIKADIIRATRKHVRAKSEKRLEKRARKIANFGSVLLKKNSRG